MTKWISVKDRLPDCSDFIIGNFRDVPPFIAIGWKPYNYDETWVKYTGGELLHINNITHWMPLPDAPKESNND